MLFACFGWFWRFRLGFTRGKKYHWAPKPIIIYMPALNVFLRVSGFRRFRVGLIEGNNYHWAPKTLFIKPALNAFWVFRASCDFGLCYAFGVFRASCDFGLGFTREKIRTGPQNPIF